MKRFLAPLDLRNSRCHKRPPIATGARALSRLTKNELSPLSALRLCSASRAACPSCWHSQRFLRFFFAGISFFCLGFFQQQAIGGQNEDVAEWLKNFEANLTKIKSAEIVYGQTDNMLDFIPDGNFRRVAAGRWVINGLNETAEFFRDWAAENRQIEVNDNAAMHLERDVQYYDETGNFTVIFDPKKKEATIQRGRHINRLVLPSTFLGRVWPTWDFFHVLVKDNESARLLIDPANTDLGTFSFDNGARTIHYEITVSKAHDFRPVVMKIQGSKVQMIYEIELAAENGIWMPKVVDYKRRNGDDELWRIDHWTAKTIRVNAPSSEMTEPQLPVGTLVRDEITGGSFIVGQTEDRIRSVIETWQSRKSTPRARETAHTGIFVVVALFVFALAAGISLLLKRRHVSK